MRVLFLTIFDKTGPSSRVRAYQYVSGLQKMGYDISIKPLISSEYFQYLNGSKRFSILKKIYFTLIMPGFLLFKRIADVFSARFMMLFIFRKIR